MNLKVALVGMPNVGKTALFNKLTGSFQRVANFAGVTVEKKIGEVIRDGKKLFEVVDLPGIYSLDATTLDEKVTKDFLLQKSSESVADLFVLVLDATNLDKSLFLAYQLKELGYPLVISLNLIDEALKRKLKINLEKMERELGATIVVTSAATGEGVERLVKVIESKSQEVRTFQVNLPANYQKTFRSPLYVNSIFKRVDSLLKEITIHPLAPDSFSEKIDHYVLHPFWGLIILVSILFLMFQMLFSWSAPIQEIMETGFSLLGELVSANLNIPILRSLIVDGIINGVGGILVFLPQIVFLFLFIQFLEDLGYLGRAAYLLDGYMRKMGLPGKAVIPLLSSHACAIPGIMATRVIDNYRERLITMLVIPLTTCSARLPVYAILISALIPDISVAGISWIRLPGLVFFLLYLIGFVSALIVALVFKKFLPDPSPSMLLMELPPYRVPKFKNLFLVMKNQAKVFLKKAGGAILVVSLIIWFLMSFPNNGEISNLNDSYAASIGRFFGPVFKPLGFDWRMTTALIPSIGAREVVISALSMVMSIKEGSSGFDENMSRMLNQEFGIPALCALLVWFIFSPQCFSTLAVLKRETGSLRWPILVASYTLVLAYLFAWLTNVLVSLWF